MNLSQANRQMIRDNYNAWVVHHLTILGNLNLTAAQEVLNSHKIAVENYQSKGLRADQSAKTILATPVRPINNSPSIRLFY